MMYNLFEVVRLLSVGKEQGVKRKHKIFVKTYAWKEEGEISLLALACSNDSILLRYSLFGKAPVIKQLPWLPDRVIVSMCFDPTVTWLLILTETPQLFIIPAFSLLEPNVRVNQIWRTDDVTCVTMEKLKDNVTVTKWWHTFDDQQIAIIGSKSGEIVFVDLLQHKVVATAQVDKPVRKLELVQNDTQTDTYLLITAVSGQQWKLVLETHSEMVSQLSHDTGVRQVSGAAHRHPIKNILTAAEEDKETFVPVQYTQFQRSVTLTSQYARSRHFVIAHCDKSSTLQVYDSDLQHSPLFVYKLPVSVYNVVLTDRLVFCVSRLSGKKLLVLSSQRSEVSLDNQQDFNTEAVVQQFDLPANETILGVEKRKFPFYWHDNKGDYIFSYRGNESAAGCTEWIDVKSHTVLEGCVFVTNQAVYECRPSVSPEHLFLHLAITKPDPRHAETLAVNIGLNVTTLFEVAADCLLRTGDVTRAIRLYHLSKCSYVKRASNLAKTGHTQEVVGMLHHTLRNMELSSAERKELADLLLYCYVHQLREHAQSTPAVSKSFRCFLHEDFSFSEEAALNLLCDNFLFDCLLEFAKGRGLVMETLSLLISKSQFSVNKDQLVSLASRGFSSHLLKAGKGCLLQCLPADDLVSLLLTQPQLAVLNMQLIESQLSQLSESSLAALAETFDPSKPVIKSFLAQTHSSRYRTVSVGSLSSLTSFSSDSDVSVMSNGRQICRLVEFFVRVVLLLSKHRNVNMKTLKLSHFTSETETNQSKHPVEISGETTRRLKLQRCLIGCQSCHSAVIRNSDLYSWGSPSHGKLGHGELTGENKVCVPSRVEVLHMLQLKVQSVGCGQNHTVVITEQGVYGWGSSHYGQVGVGTRHSYSRPMLIDTIGHKTCISVICGHYHTLMLTDDCELYSWGWGVHGQLGHSDPEDRLLPTVVKSLAGRNVVKIAAGYCHSLALTEQGDLYVFGCGYFGQLGLGNNLKQSTPRKLDTIGESITVIGAKYFTSIAVTVSNKVYVWGCHPYGLRCSAQMLRRARQHGQPLSDPVNSFLLPACVDTTYVNGDIVQVTAGSLHCVILTSEGEVYVWGYNMDGQLGIGTKQEEKIPKMLTKINDYHIVTVGAGGEYTVAMDINGQILVWGKNDTGQLGLDTSETGKKKLHSHHQHHVTSTYEVLAPVKLTGLPREEHTVQLPRQQSDSSDLWLYDDDKEDQLLNLLPDLDTVGETKYCCKVIPLVVKFLSHVCCVTDIIRLCVDHSDWLTAADISILLGNNIQALCYHLQAVSQMDGDKKSELSAQIAQYHIRLCVEKMEEEKEQTEELKSMIVEIFRHWDRCDLPVSDLELLFTENLHLLALPIGLVIFSGLRVNKAERSKQLYVEQFSTQFCLRVLHCVLTGHPDWMDRQWTCGQQLTEATTVEIQTQDKLTVYDQVWRDVVQNLEKNYKSQSHISLTKHETGHLGQQNLTDNSSVKPLTVLFTCGHHFTQESFTREIVVSLEDKLTDKLPFTMSLLKQYYNRDGLLPLACPKCVLSALITLS